MFSLIVATLGAGTMGLPQVAIFMGIFPGNLLIILGSALSMYTGMLLISCAVKTKSDRYEDFAMAAYGPRACVATSWFVMLSLLGVVVSYITLLKGLIPQILTIIAFGNIPDKDDMEHKLPYIIGMDQWGG